MSKKAKNKAIAKALYLSGHSIEKVASIMDIGVRTIQMYKAEDFKEEVNWDKLRVVKYMDNSQKDSATLYGDFVAHMYSELACIREDKDLKSQERIDAIVKLGDSFSKMRRIAAVENPEAYTHGIIKMTIQKLIRIIQPSIPPECLETIVDQIKKNQEELADVSI